jgi:hypothetical protein
LAIYPQSAHPKEWLMAEKQPRFEPQVVLIVVIVVVAITIFI